MPKTRGIKKQPDNLIKCHAIESNYTFYSDYDYDSKLEPESASKSTLAILFVVSRVSCFIAPAAQWKRLQFD